MFARLSTSLLASSLIEHSRAARRRCTPASLSRHDAFMAALCPPTLSSPWSLLVVLLARELPSLYPVPYRVSLTDATGKEVTVCGLAAAAAAARLVSHALLLLGAARAYLSDQAREWRCLVLAVLLSFLALRKTLVSPTRCFPHPMINFCRPTAYRIRHKIPHLHEITHRTHNNTPVMPFPSANKEPHISPGSEDTPPPEVRRINFTGRVYQPPPFFKFCFFAFA